jgi:N-acetylneuraminic acid mutarotase
MDRWIFQATQPFPSSLKCRRTLHGWVLTPSDVGGGVSATINKDSHKSGHRIVTDLATTQPFKLRTLLLVILAVIVPSLSAAQSTWKPLANMPVGKWEAGTVVLDGRLYFFGGYTPGVRSSKRCDVYDPTDNSWTRIQDLPSAITHMNMVLDGRTVWFAGGFKDGYKGHTIAEVWNYDVDKDRYTAAPLLPETRGGGGLALVDRKLHYIGGVKADRDTDAEDHWVLDLDGWARGSARWENAAPLPAPRNQASTVSFDGKIYVIGGQLHHDSMQLDQARVDIYDPHTDSWSRGPQLPKGHSHSEGGTFVSGGRILVVGGHTTPSGGRKRIDPDILALQPGGDWEKIGELPLPLSSPTAAVIAGKLYVAGGSPDGRSVQAKMWVGEVP